MRPHKVLLLLAVVPGCYGSPEAANGSDFTHPASGTTPAGDQNVAPAPITTQTQALKGFNITWQINPNQCLQPAVNANTPTPVTTAVCNGTVAQRWTWSAGSYVNAETGTCLAPSASVADAAVEVIDCNQTTSLKVWFDNYNGQIFQSVDGNLLMMAPTGTSTGVGTLFSLQTSIPPVASREFALTIASPTAVQTGFTMVPTNSPNDCLTATSSGLRVLPCGQATTAQLWNFDNATFSQGSQCLNANNGVMSMVACDASVTAQQWWLGAGGDIVSGTSAGTPICLFANPNASVSLVPNSTANRAWSFGGIVLE